jgi:hypothetical protein
MTEEEKVLLTEPVLTLTFISDSQHLQDTEDNFGEKDEEGVSSTLF